MQKQRFFLMIIAAGILLMLAASFWLMTATPAKAQCGSQASSCKNCHEVQGQDPVNADGTGWHQSHAFGDFCYICHAGNNQAKDKVAAHQGMVDPLSDIKSACQQCHAADLQQRAQVYATALGVKIDSGSAAPASSGNNDTSSASEVAAPNGATAQECDQIVLNDPNAVNYAQNYDEIVLGKKPINWGNMILGGMIGLMLIGGGGFVITREKFINVKFGDTRKVEEEYPADVVEMLPKIAGLKAGVRKSLKNLLENKKADKMLDLMDEITKNDEE